MTNRISPDDREPTEDTSKPAKRGNPKPDHNLKAADTWLTEARRNAELAVRYYRKAAEFYAASGYTDRADSLTSLAQLIEESALSPEIRLLEWEGGDMGLIHVNHAYPSELYGNAKCIRVPQELMIQFMIAVKNGDYDEQIGL